MTNPTQLPLKDIQQKIDNASSILIVLPSSHTIDNVAAALAFYLSLQKYNESKEKKSSLTIASATDPTVAFQRLYGVGDISHNLGSKNLVISLKTAHENIEKISVDEGTTDFNIIIETKSGVPKLEQEDVSFSHRGLDADLIIAIGLTNAEAAGFFYTQNPSLFADRESIIICGDPRAGAFGSLNIIETQASGNSELVAKLLRFLKFPVDGDICTNLIAGVEAVTVNFASRTSADTFAAIAWCMKEGGRRNHLSMPINQQAGFGAPSFGAGAGSFGQNPFASPNPFAANPAYSQPYNAQAFTQPQAQAIMPVPNQIPLTYDNAENNNADKIDNNQNDQVPADWLEPKVYRGGQS